MDHDKLMARGAERQELIEALKREVFEEDTPRELDTGLPLIHAILEYFRRHEGFAVVETTQARITEMFEKRIVPSIEGFTDVSEERLKILADLLLWQAESVGRKYQNEYSRKETDIFSN